MVCTIPPQVEMGSTVVTIEAGMELSQSKSPPGVIGVSDTVKAQQHGHVRYFVICLIGSYKPIALHHCLVSLIQVKHTY